MAVSLSLLLIFLICHSPFFSFSQALSVQLEGARTGWGRMNSAIIRRNAEILNFSFPILSLLFNIFTPGFLPFALYTEDA